VAAGRIKAKDVRATMHLDFNHFKPTADGSAMVRRRVVAVHMARNPHFSQTFRQFSQVQTN
jgi:hypothetical protein